MIIINDITAKTISELSKKKKNVNSKVIIG